MDRCTINTTLCSKYFKSSSGLSFTLINCPTIDSRIPFTISHFFYETVTNNPTSSIALTMAPFHSPGAWVIGNLFLVASWKPKYPIMVSTWWVISQQSSHVAHMEPRSYHLRPMKGFFWRVTIPLYNIHRTRKESCSNQRGQQKDHSPPFSIHPILSLQLLPFYIIYLLSRRHPPLQTAWCLCQ